MLAPIYTKCSTINVNNITVYSARIVCLLMFAYVWECLLVRDRKCSDFFAESAAFPLFPPYFTLLLSGQ